MREMMRFCFVGLYKWDRLDALIEFYKFTFFIDSFYFVYFQCHLQFDGHD